MIVILFFLVSKWPPPQFHLPHQRCRCCSPREFALPAPGCSSTGDVLQQLDVSQSGLHATSRSPSSDPTTTADANTAGGTTTAAASSSGCHWIWTAVHACYVESATSTTGMLRVIIAMMKCDSCYLQVIVFILKHDCEYAIGIANTQWF